MQNILIGVVLLILLALLVFVYYATTNGGPNTTSTSSTVTTSVTTIGTTTITGGVQIYQPANEISAVTRVYPNTTLSTFSCITNNDCVIVHTDYCFNNAPLQQACINRDHSGVYASYYERFLANGGIVCPMYFELANASCACINQGCSLIYRPE